MSITDTFDWLAVIAADKRLSASTLRVAVRLAWMHHHAGEPLLSTYCALRDRAGLSLQAIRLSITALQNAGYVRRSGCPCRVLLVPVAQHADY